MTQLQNDTLAAISSLAATPAPVTDKPDYELLEAFYTDRVSPLLHLGEPQQQYPDKLYYFSRKYDDSLWERIKADSRLLLVFRAFAWPLLGESPESDEIAILEPILAEILSPQSELLPELKQRAARLLAYLRRAGIVDAL
jgi:hypothetical protein